MGVIERKCICDRCRQIDDDGIGIGFFLIFVVIGLMICTIIF